MPHAFAGAFQKAGRVVERRPVEEADIHMSAEGVDIPERRISHARGGMAIVQKLANVRSATAHLFKPWLGDPSQLVIGLGKPNVNAGVSPNGAWEPQELAHQARLPALPVMSRRSRALLCRHASKPTWFGNIHSRRSEGLAVQRQVAILDSVDASVALSHSLRRQDMKSGRAAKN